MQTWERYAADAKVARNSTSKQSGGASGSGPGMSKQSGGASGSRHGMSKQSGGASGSGSGCEAAKSNISKMAGCVAEGVVDHGGVMGRASRKQASLKPKY
jgi:hypothetical protein